MPNRKNSSIKKFKAQISFMCIIPILKKYETNSDIENCHCIQCIKTHASIMLEPCKRCLLWKYQ